jgi:hypothetical protein
MGLKTKKKMYGKFCENSRLIPLASNSGIGAYAPSVSLSLLNFGILDCVGKGVSISVRQLGAELVGGFITLVFLDLMGHLLQEGALK